MQLITFFIAVCVVIIIVILLRIEYKYFTKSLKHIVKCPIKYEVYDDVIIYNIKYKDEMETLFDKTMNEYKYKYIPKVLISSRITKPVNNFISDVKNIHKETIVSDVLNSAIPFCNVVNDLLDTTCDYEVISKKSDLNVVYNNGYIIY